MRTRAGYTGGGTPDPTYHNLGNHTETLQIDYDPKQLSYAQFLELFWKSHSPIAPKWSRQYMAALFVTSDAERQLAEESKARLGSGLRGSITTEILPAEHFWRAEDYHQKYWLRGTPELYAEFERFYPVDQDFVDSTAAARVNGYLGGQGKLPERDDDWAALGLSAAGRELLRRLGGRRG